MDKDLNWKGLLRALIAGDCVALGRALSLVESALAADQLAADALLDALPVPKASLRIGITGAAGAGKSTLIASLVQHIMAQTAHKVAILPYDPSSPQSGGSLLGDRVRMAELSTHERIFVRPSSSKGQMGGIGTATMESIALCEAAGHTLTFVETLGAGQQDIRIRDVVDVCVVLLLPRTGDDIQGIKRGILEMADLVVVHKADGAAEKEAKKLSQSYSQLSALWGEGLPGWRPPILSVSSHEKKGIENLWQHIQSFVQHLKAHHLWHKQRQSQTQRAFQAYCEKYLMEALNVPEALRLVRKQAHKQIAQKPQLAPRPLAKALVKKYLAKPF